MSSKENSVVRLNVYDMSPVNGWTKFLGLGIYHIGLEIHRTEYFFTGHDEDSSGVIVIKPCSFENWTKSNNWEGFVQFKCSIVVGQTDKSEEQVRAGRWWRAGRRAVPWNPLLSPQQELQPLQL